MTHRFQVPPLVHARRFDDEVVLIHLSEGKYFALDTVAATIWEALVAGKSAEEAIAVLVGEYDVDEGTARRDVERLARELLGAGLLEPRRDSVA
jgi:hypothetical protein